MTKATGEISLSTAELREVAKFAAECAQEVVAIFENDRPDDARPRDALTAAWTFARGGNRTHAMRAIAMAAHRAARDTTAAGAGDAACAAGSAAAAAYLHPLAQSTQVKHILGAAAHAARASELADGSTIGVKHIELARERAGPAVVAVLRRYPVAPDGGGRVGELLRTLDAALRR